MITNLKSLKKYASLKADFTWDDIPKFAVISGINGSGKTQLLDIIYDSCRLEVGRRGNILLTPDLDFRNQIQYIRFNHSPEDLSRDNSGVLLGTAQRIEDRNSQLLHYLKNEKSRRTNSDYNKFIEKLEKEENSSIEELLERDSTKVFSHPEFIQCSDNGFNNKFIAEIFKAYDAKISAIKIKNHDNKTWRESEDIYKLIGFPPPWKVINDLFDRYGFLYHITEPRSAVTYIPEFIEKDVTNPIEFARLSTGEKIIVSLILWAYNKNLGNKNKIVLLDEFDAHLNPSMSKMFIEVVKEKLVKEFGIQVLMTTHSPSTVARVNDKDLFWMERGKNIRRSSKEEIIPILSDGIMTFREASSLMEYVLESKNSIIIFTEGKTDSEHIKVASQKLNIQVPFSIFPIGDDNGGGSDKLKSFLTACPALLFQDKIVIGVFDCDEKGCGNFQEFAAVDSVQENLRISKTNPNVYALLLPVPEDGFKKYQNCPIEFLYPKEVLVANEVLSEKRAISDINKYQKNDPMNNTQYATRGDLCFYTINKRQKTRFVEKIQELSIDAFKNFQRLFDLIATVNSLSLTSTES